MNGPVQVQHSKRRVVRFVFRFDKKFSEPDLNWTPETLYHSGQFDVDLRVDLL
jgi:hypothetical protein